MIRIIKLPPISMPQDRAHHAKGVHSVHQNRTHQRL